MKNLSDDYPFHKIISYSFKLHIEFIFKTNHQYVSHTFWSIWNALIQVTYNLILFFSSALLSKKSELNAYESLKEASKNFS